MVVAKGDPDAGAVLIKLNCLDGRFALYAQVRDIDGNPCLSCLTGPDPVAESDADTRIARERRFDPDIWVVEIEDREGRLPWDLPLLSS